MPSLPRLAMQTPDGVQSNVERIRELFPNCVTETRDEDTGQLKHAVDFDQLRQELSGELVEGPKERYQLTWPGKRQAILTANAPIRKTLRPAREESVDFDTTQNLFIEGDNLDALKLLQETYLGKVKMIYIDPPYNTGKDFVYKDNFTENTQEYLERSGQRDEQGNRLQLNSDSNGRYHSDWLTMMYSRLKIARNLLSQDGFIAIHIDEHEIGNLEQLIVELFGSSNYIGPIVWDKAHPKGDAHGIGQQHEYVVLAIKDGSFVQGEAFITRKKPNALAIVNKGFELKNDPSKFRKWLSDQSFSGGEKAYNKLTSLGRVYQGVSMAWPNKQSAPQDYQIPLIHPVTGEKCPVPPRGWRNPSSTMLTLLEKGEVDFGLDHTTQPRRRYYLDEHMTENIPSVLKYSTSDDLSVDFGLHFDNPKPLDIAKILLGSIPNHRGIILDFFAGSGTTGHAVMKLNAEDGGNLKYICVQLPEETPEKSEARKAGYTSIADISKERLRRAGKKIQEEHPDWHGDTGFRVLKVDTTSMQDVYYSPSQTSQEQLTSLIDNVKQDRSAEDLLFQVMLDMGVPLDLPIERIEVKGAEVFVVGHNDLVACFARRLSEDTVKAIAQLQPDRVVLRDAAFGSDSAKINAEQVRKHFAPESTLKVL